MVDGGGLALLTPQHREGLCRESGSGAVKASALSGTETTASTARDAVFAPWGGKGRHAGVDAGWWRGELEGMRVRRTRPAAAVLLAGALAIGCGKPKTVEVDCSPGSPIKPGNPAICMVRNETYDDIEVCWSVRFFDGCGVSEVRKCAEVENRIYEPVEVYSDCEKEVPINTTNGPAIDIVVAKR